MDGGPFKFEKAEPTTITKSEMEKIFKRYGGRKGKPKKKPADKAEKKTKTTEKKTEKKADKKQ